MVTESGSTGAGVMDPPVAAEQAAFRALRAMLVKEPFRVQFFQAVRMLQRMEPNGKAVGYFEQPDGEIIRFCSLPSLSFPPSELYSLERSPQGQYTMTVQFMGICAAISVLPSPYTELLLERMRSKDRVMVDFFDIFNHRMISFFYRGWEKYRFYIGYENTADDRMSGRLMDLLGLGTDGLGGATDLPDRAYLNYVGLLGRHVRSSASLQQILEDYFGVPVKIQQFAGTWRKLEPSNQTCFTGLGGPSERLGVGVVAGDEVWDHHGRIRVSMGPMNFERYVMFLPGNAGHRDLSAWLRFHSNRMYETEVQLILKREEAPACELGAEGSGQAQLGFVSWLKTKPMKQDPADATYLVQ